MRHTTGKESNEGEDKGLKNKYNRWERQTTLIKTDDKHKKTDHEHKKTENERKNI